MNERGENLRVEGLVVGYARDAPVAGPFSFSLGPGIQVLFGRNGAGKTTLMRTLCGIIPPLAGTVLVDGVRLGDGDPIRSMVGYLGHRTSLTGRLTVAENLRFWYGVYRSCMRFRLMPLTQLVEEFDLSAIMDRRVSRLSRGQLQRVDLARMALARPSVIVLDEPLTGLDPIYASDFRSLFRKWGQERILLYSTHSVPEALEMGGRYMVLHDGTMTNLGGDSRIDERDILEVLGRRA